MLIVKLGREGLRYMMVIFLETDSQNVIYNLLRRLFEKMQYNDMRFFDGHRTGDLMTRMSADLDWCRHFLSFIDYRIIDAVCTFLFATVYLALVNWKLTLLSDPAILILDEATSSIDTQTEKLLQEGIAEMLKGRTSIIVAHRLSTIKNCDKILYISHKGIAEMGSHAELMQKKGLYYQLYTAQVREEAA